MEEQNNFFSLYDLSFLILKRKLLIVLTMVFCCIVGYGTYFFVPYKYKAISTIFLVNSQKENSIIGKIGGISAFTKLGLSQGNNQSYINIEILNSKSMALKFIEQKNMLSFVYPECLGSEIKNNIDRNKACNKITPTNLDGAIKFNSLLSISDNKQGNSIQVSLTHRNPTLAADALNAYIKFVDQNIRKKAREESEANIVFIKEKIKSTLQSDLKNLFYSLLEKEMQNQKLIDAKTNYAFEVIDPAYPPKIPISISRKMILIISLLAGLILGTFFSFLMEFVIIGNKKSNFTERKP